MHVWKEFKRSYLVIGERIPPMRHYMQTNKNPSTSNSYIFLRCWPQGSCRPPPTLQDMAKLIDYTCWLQPHSETLLLMASCAISLNVEKSKHSPTRSLTLYWLAVIVLELTVRMTRGEKDSSFSPSYELCELQYMPAYAIVAQML